MLMCIDSLCLSLMACLNRPKPPYSWFFTIFLCLITTTSSDPQDRYSYREVDDQQIRDMLDKFIQTQDPKYFNPNVYDVNRGQDGRFADANRGQDGRFTEESRRTISNQQLKTLLKQIDDISSQQCTENVLAQWNFETNVNDATQVEALQAQLAYTEFQNRVRHLVMQIHHEHTDDPRLWRELRYLSVIGPAALPPDQLDRYNRLINDMLTIYNSASICAYNEPLKCGLHLDPDLTNLMAESRDWNELQHTWVEWYRKSGQKMRDLYEQLIELSNYSARLNNLTDYADYWMYPYEAASFRFDLEDTWEQIRPLYEQLHAYVRRKLRDLYGPEKISRQAPIPAHILGNMWAQTWTNILDITIPYPGKNFIDVTPEMLRQGYTPGAMFRLAEEFFVSLNLSAMPPDFWANSILEEPLERPVVCQPSAWDFCNGRDYRIKMCTHTDMSDLITAHHEMAHIQYFLQYKNQPKIFRDGANPGFHEAVSEAIALSVATPHHLQTLGLLLNSADDVPHNINYLFTLAMDKVAFLPFSLALDFWRWDLFQGTTSRDRYNCHWWDLREKLSGIKPPVLRSEVDFDAGAKYHVPANIPYIRYFVGTVLQFQIHRAMCRAAGQSGTNTAYGQPLHKCDIYRSKEAGRILAKLMEKGASEPWSEVLYAATGETKLDGSAIREFFQPLEDWLRNENRRTQEFVGWSYDGDYCKYSIETANLQVYGGFYNTASSITSMDMFIYCLIISVNVFYNKMY
uniref:Angiotensin-converting enzyme n=2 Tax=Clastoptera arizonana TaxID=38151 RepID=A0A1B6DUB7_9HEMI